MIKSFGNKGFKDNTARMLLVLLPLFLVILVSLVEKAPLFSIFPIGSNDEIGYWREMYSFDRLGFDFGKNGWVGYDAASIGPFGCHGLLQVAAWGWYALLFDWGHHSIYIANFIMLTAAFLAFVFLAKPDHKECLLIFLFSLCYRPLSIYMDSSLMEIPCFAAVLFYFAAFIFYCRKTDSKARFALCIAAGLYCSILRICYIVILFPTIMVNNKHRIDLKLILKMSLYVLAFLLIYIVYNKTTAQYPQWFLTELSNDSSLSVKLMKVLGYFKEGLIAYFAQIWDRMIWFVSSYASFERIKYLLTVSFPELFFPIRILDQLLKIILLLPDRKDGKWVFNKTKFWMFVMLLTFDAGIIALYDVSGWVDTRVISSLLYGIIIWLILLYSDRLKKRSFYAVCFILLLVSLMTIRIMPAKGNGHYAFKDYETVFEPLKEYEGKPSLAVDLELIDGPDALSIVTALPENYGILLYSDKTKVYESRPEFVYSASELELNDYNGIHKDPEKGYLYIRK